MTHNHEEKELFYPSGIIMYRGGVKKNDFGHDIYDGKGSLFDQEGELLFEGEFVNHMKQGNGIMYLKGQLIYQGEFIQNKKQGHGILYKDGHIHYEGHFRNDLMDGYGVLYYEEEVISPYQTLRAQYPHLNQPQYEGDFVHGMKKGKGKQYYPNGFLQYEGDFIWHHLQGAGKLYYPTESPTAEELARGVTTLHYEGHFFEDLKHGKGKVYARDGILEAEGQFKEDMMTGQGTLYYANGQASYIGDLVQGKKHGRGDYYNEEGKIIYSGEFINDERLRITPEVEQEIAKLQKQLDSLVGLPNAKKELHNLINFIKIQSLRVDHGLTSFPITYHLVFSGNPGTGKTTVARIIGQIYKHLGVLSSGHFVETDRAGLVAGYVGQTALKVQEVVNKAKGGVLFIDEAYSLMNDKQDAFGKEAIDSLLKVMEDLRDDLVIIVAGYTELIEEFLQSNPGFKSRFNHFVQFDNFSTDELYDIFAMLCQTNDYQFGEAFAQHMKTQLRHMPIETIPNFSNGRYIRNLFEKLVTIQSNRLIQQAIISREELMTFEEQDILQGIAEKLFDNTF
ncbi:AAA family ATPase [Lysinibacillus capsici]|uniref:AAA family ATPase n=1 Tax=Lysinibacillus capsici TaxID=2115968 RepID=UPI0001DA5237|nr:AAA family ATPase [Lysinibacillus capsici]EFI70199.1 stage V sporulation protein K [Lysinibacillus fusiformis ZC1]EKU44817.1 stage V sporulation protein K [Lysinibacillus fusiformis ZB2]MBU5251791.1 AAA family ATPase [Lysinibacillus capsici]MED4700583.1 AAA family ATPase [Lysinibacillus capsici]